MIPIKYKGNTVPQVDGKPTVYAGYLEDYYKAMMPKRYSSNVKRLNDWCKVNIFLEKETAGEEWSFKDVVCASPKNIIRLKELIDGLSEKERKSLVDVSGYVTRVLYTSRMGNGGAREMLERSAKVHVCPYCNRNLTKQINVKDKFKTTCELDHFFSKGGRKGTDPKGYSLLAVSYYNLIPVCHLCNMTKGDDELKAFYPYGFGWNETDRIRFTYYPLKCDYMDETESLDVAIKFEARDLGGDDDKNSYEQWRRKDVLSDINILHLAEIYQNNRYEVQKLLRKNLVYEDKYSEMIFKEFGEYFSSVREVSDLMLDRVKELTDVANVPLGKLMHDISREVSGDYFGE